jgi:hypothetical protein
MLVRVDGLDLLIIALSKPPETTSPAQGGAW